MIDTTGSNICHCVIQTTHGLSPYIRIVFCSCHLHIYLLSLPLTLQRYNKNLRYASKSAKIFHFSLISISTQYVKDLFCRLFSPRQDLLSSLFILFLLCTFCTFALLDICVQQKYLTISDQVHRVNNNIMINDYFLHPKSRQ